MNCIRNIQYYVNSSMYRVNAQYEKIAMNIKCVRNIYRMVVVETKNNQTKKKGQKIKSTNRKV